MAEAAAVPAPVVVPVAGRGRGRGKAKGKKGKAKAKGKKGKFVAKAPVLGEDGLPIPKKPREVKVNLRQQVEQEIGDRDIEDVIKDARANVEKLQAAVSKAQEAELAYETSITEGKMKMEVASSAVDTCVHKETIALEKFKAAREAAIIAQKKVTEKKLEFGDEEKALNVLATEGEAQKNDADLIRAKHEAHEAKEAAKKALHEAIAKEKAAAEEIKAKRSALAITDDPEAAAKAAKEAANDAEEAKAKQDLKTGLKAQGRELMADVKALEKQRAERDKERAKLFKEAAGLGKAKKRLALGDGAAGSPAKGAKIQDVD